MPQANGSSPVLLSAAPIVVPVSLNGSVVMDTASAQVSPPTRTADGDSDVDPDGGLDSPGLGGCADRRKETRSGPGEAITTKDSPSRTTSFPTFFDDMQFLDPRQL